MPMVEIDENELIENRKTRAALAKIMANPEARKLAEQAHKMVDPNALTPALDQDQRIKEPLSAIEKRMEDFIAKQQERDAEREKNEKLNSIATKIAATERRLRSEGWTDEGIAGVKKLAEDNGILDLDIAASHFERLHPPQQLATPSGVGGWNFIEGVQDGETDLKKLIETKGESQPLIDKMSRDALNEVRGQGRR